MTIESLDHLESLLSEPTPQAVSTLAALKGDMIILGVGGKMGPSLARMVKRASDLSGTPRKVVGVARFSNPELEAQLHAAGIETIRCDLLNEAEVNTLPEVANVVAMVGLKFGATGQESLTWAMNSHVPALICKKFRASRIVAFSTGNVYGLTRVRGGGSCETDPLNPVGEYAQSGVGRERIYEYFSRTFEIPMALLRLNYAVEMRYGVLVDIAQKVLAGEAIDLTMGNVNVIWQGDANAMALCSFGVLTSGPAILNLAGPETLSVRRVAESFAKLLGARAIFTGAEQDAAFLSNGQLGHRLFGYPRVSAEQMIHWIADWLQRGMPTLGKPTHFEVRDGKY